MNKHLKISFALLASIFALSACGQNNSAGSATETTQVAQTTTSAPTTQVASNKQAATDTLPKDGEAVYKKEEKGRTTTLKYYFKDDIVYKQDAVYTFNPKEMGKTEEEIQKIIKKRQALYDGVKGFETTISQKDGIYIHTLKIDYNNIDREELHRRDPKGFPDTKAENLLYSEAVKKLLDNGYVKQ